MIKMLIFNLFLSFILVILYLYLSITRVTL
jgi:hypothetical protein